MNSRLLLTVYLILIVLISCTIDKPLLPYEGLNIFAVLNNRADTQRIYIDTIAGISNSRDSIMSVDNADVYINGTQLPYIENGGSLSGYYIYTDSVASGKEYALQMYYNNDTINAMTTIPDPVRIIFPVEGYPLPLDTFSLLVWSGNADFYSIDIRRSGDSLSMGMLYQFNDTIVPLFSFIPFLDSGEYYDFTVTAIDSNYMLYLFGNDEMGSNRGVFGSFMSSTVESIQVIELK